jgi:hypothetical protein
MSYSTKSAKGDIIKVNASGSLYVDVADLEQTQEYKDFTHSIRSLKFANELAADVKAVGSRIKARLAAERNAESVK